MDIESFFSTYGDLFLVKQLRQEDRELKKAEEALKSSEQFDVKIKV